MALINFTQLMLPSSVLSGDGVPIGTIIAYGGAIDPAGYLLCDGRALLRTEYHELFTVIGTLYGATDDEHFNIPNLISRFPEGSATPGQTLAPGLPNITGTLRANMQQDATYNTVYSGAFSGTRSASGLCSVGGSYESANVSFNAALSSSIYGNSSTVQPAALTVRYAIKTTTTPSTYAGINKRDVIRESGTFIAPVTGWYRFIIKGGGGGGHRAWNASPISGSSGGEGGTSFAFEFMNVNTKVDVFIGAGGDGVPLTGSYNTPATNGGNTSVTINNKTYTAYGGYGAIHNHEGGAGGDGDINGANGHPGIRCSTGGGQGGATGGGQGGARDILRKVSSNETPYTTPAINGGGGHGGDVAYNSYQGPGGPGGDGFVVIEYFDPSLR